MPDVSHRNAFLAQFDELVAELMSGTMQRGRFQSWEMEILLDLEELQLNSATVRNRLLRRYQDAVHRQTDESCKLPLEIVVLEILQVFFLRERKLKIASKKLAHSFRQ